MSLSDVDRQWLQEHRTAAMITVAGDGSPKAVRVGVAFVDGRLWSSGTRDRIRTDRLRQDPRCTLFVFDDTYAWLSLETTVTILDGPDAPALNVRLFREMQGRPQGSLNWFGTEQTEEEFRRTMTDEGRLIYEFEVQRSYGLH